MTNAERLQDAINRLDLDKRTDAEFIDAITRAYATDDAWQRVKCITDYAPIETERDMDLLWNVFSPPFMVTFLDMVRDGIQKNDMSAAFENIRTVLTAHGIRQDDARAIAAACGIASYGGKAKDGVNGIIIERNLPDNGGIKRLAEITSTTIRGWASFTTVGIALADYAYNGNTYAPAELSAISVLDEFMMPTAPLFRYEMNVANAGSDGYVMDIKRQGTTAPVNIAARITDANGNAPNITAFDKAVQRGIGNLIDDNGGVLPITVTADRVYRAMERLPLDATVTNDQAAKVMASIDKMRECPALIDIHEQMQAYTHMKHQDGHENAGIISDHMINARKLTRIYNGSTIVVYNILAYPMYYDYSVNIVRQMRKMPNAVLSDVTVTKRLDGRADNVALKQEITERIAYMRTRKSGKTYDNMIHMDEILTACNATTDREKRTVRKNITEYLDALKEQGEISGYTEKKGMHGKIDGYAITL